MAVYFCMCTCDCASCHSYSSQSPIRLPCVDCPSGAAAHNRMQICRQIRMCVYGLHWQSQLCAASTFCLMLSGTLFVLIMHHKCCCCCPYPPSSTLGFCYAGTAVASPCATTSVLGSWCSLCPPAEVAKLVSTATQQSSSCIDSGTVSITPAILQGASWPAARLCDTSTCRVVPLFFCLSHRFARSCLCLMSAVQYAVDMGPTLCPLCGGMAVVC